MSWSRASPPTISPADTSRGWYLEETAWRRKAGQQRVEAESLPEDTRCDAYRPLGLATALPRRWTEDGSTSVLPTNQLRPHNVKEEAAVAAVDAKAEAAAGVPRSGADAMEVEG